MLETLIYGIQWCTITGGVILASLLIALLIQAIVYRATKTKISIYKILMKSLLK